MTDFLCQQQLLAMFPWFAWFLAVWAVVRVSCQVLAEIMFLIAHVCGKIDHAVTKWIGKASWTLGLFFGFVGGGTSRQFLRKKYVPRHYEEGDNDG